MHLHLVVSRLHGYYVEVSGLLAPDSFCNFIIGFCFSFFERPNPKSENALDNKRKEKGDGLIHFE